MEPAGYANDVLDKLGWLSAEFVNREYMGSERDEADVQARNHFGRGQR